MDTCKICGAPRDPLNSNCKFCGTAYTLERVTGEVYITGLQTILRAIEQESANEKSSLSLPDLLYGKNSAVAMARVGQCQATAISTFAMPSDVESLLQFLAFCHGNAQIKVGFFTANYAAGTLKSAWLGKAKMAYAQLKMKSISNPNLTAYIQEYESTYGHAAKPSGGFVGFIRGIFFGKK